MLKKLLRKFTGWLESQAGIPDLRALNRAAPLLINTFDIDGVIFINHELRGVYPGPVDLIITGRSFEEAPETYAMLRARGIYNKVYFNQLPFHEKTRISSGRHKAHTLNLLMSMGVRIGCHFEDDPIQVSEILSNTKGINVVRLQHELTELENTRHNQDH